MKWEIMEIEEIETVLEKIWDLHDKFSEAIHSISRAHFLNSIKNLKKSENKASKLSNDGNSAGGFVYIKEFRIDVDDSAIIEAKSLNSIRTALENLEDQLEFFHTVQVQQQVERDAAIARLEQSRMVLAMRLAEHHGKNYKVIDEALAFVGDVRYAAHFASPENQYGPPFSSNGQKLVPNSSERSNTLIKILFSTINFAKKSLKFDHVGGILGNAAMVAISMIAFLHLHQVAYKEQQPPRREDIHLKRNLRRTSQPEGPSTDDHFGNFDVLSARG